MRYFAALLGLGLLVPGTLARGGPPPKPSVVPLSWELDFEYQPVQSITLRLPGEKRPRTFWYMLFTICNRSGADRLYVPGFDLYTDTGQVLGAGNSAWGSGFLPTVHQGIEFRGQGDPVLFLSPTLTVKFMNFISFGPNFPFLNLSCRSFFIQFRKFHLFPFTLFQWLNKRCILFVSLFCIRLVPYTHFPAKGLERF